VVKLSTITKEAGLQMMGKGNRVLRIVDVLRLHGIPINVIEEKVEKSTYRYGIIAEVDQERALEVLKADTSLDDLRKQK
jgi:UDP-N-acetylglucosamine enolpyruvyl transferase